MSLQHTYPWVASLISHEEEDTCMSLPHTYCVALRLAVGGAGMVHGPAALAGRRPRVSPLARNRCVRWAAKDESPNQLGV